MHAVVVEVKVESARESEGIAYRHANVLPAMNRTVRRVLMFVGLTGFVSRRRSPLGSVPSPRLARRAEAGSSTPRTTQRSKRPTEMVMATSAPGSTTATGSRTAPCSRTTEHSAVLNRRIGRRVLGHARVRATPNRLVSRAPESASVASAVEPKGVPERAACLGSWEHPSSPGPGAEGRPPPASRRINDVPTPAAGTHVFWRSRSVRWWTL